MNRRSFLRGLTALPFVATVGRFLSGESDLWGKTLTKEDVDGWERYTYTYRNSVTGHVSFPVPAEKTVQGISLSIPDGQYDLIEVYLYGSDGVPGYVYTRVR